MPGEHRRAQAVHARAGRLEREHDPPLDVLLARVELLRADRLLADPLELAAEHLADLGQVLRPRADVEADLAGVAVEALEAEDRVGEAALLAHRLKQPRGGGATEDAVEHAQGEAALVVAGQARSADGEVVLLGVARESARCRRPARGRRPARARRRARPRRRTAAPPRPLHDAVVVDAAGRRDHDVGAK